MAQLQVIRLLGLDLSSSIFVSVLSSFILLILCKLLILYKSSIKIIIIFVMAKVYIEKKLTEKNDAPCPTKNKANA